MSVVQQPSNKPADLQRRGTTVSPLIIPARNGHRRTLKDIFVDESVGQGRIDIAVGNTTKVRIRTNLAQAILVQALDGKWQNKGFLWALAQFIPDFPFPTATEDEDITITYTVVSASVLTRIDAYFEDTTDGDLSDRTLPGGSLGTKDFMILNHYNSAAITATEEYEFDKLDVPTGASPYTQSTSIQAGGRRVSSNQKFTIYALAADVPSPGTGDKTERIHIFDEFIELFTSENNEGLFVDPEIANELAFDLDPFKSFMLPTPYVMQPNRLFNFKGDYTKAAVNAAAESQKLMLIGIREFLGGA